MALQFTQNLTPATGAVATYNIIAAMIASGSWTVKSSSDGTTYSSSGNVITGGGTGAGGLGNNLAWVRIACNSGPEWTFQHNNAGTNQTWRVKRCVNHFTGGSPGATQTPSGTNEVIALGGGTDAAPTMASFYAGADGTYTQQIAVDAAVPCGFWSFSYPTTTPGIDSCNHACYQDPLIPSAFLPFISLASPDMYAFCADGTSGDMGSQFRPGHTQANMGQNYVGGWGYTPCLDIPGPGGGGSNAVWAQEGSFDLLIPLMYNSQNQNLCGVSTLFLWNTGNRKTASRLTLNTTNDHWQVGAVVPAWNGATLGSSNGDFNAKVVIFGSPQNTVITSVTPASQQITIAFNTTISATGASAIPSNWTITAPPGNFASVTVTAISVVGQTIVLTTTEQTGGGAYILNIPNGVVSTILAAPLLAPYTQNFTGATTPTTIQAVNVIDGRTIVVIYSKPVIVSGAILPANYAINNGLSVLSVTEIDAQTYQIGTSVQTSGTAYTLTASNIFDIFFNPI